MLSVTPEPHERLKAAMDVRRVDLGLSLREVADAAGVSVETLRAVRRGSNEPSALTRRGIEKALAWTPGSVERTLAGGEPQNAPPVARIADVRFEAPAPLPVPTDEELRRTGLQPETVEALLDMRRHVERLVAKRDEDAIRRANRVLRALDEGQDAG